MSQPTDIRTVSERLLSFELDIFSRIKGTYSQKNQVRACTQAFYALTLLGRLEGPAPIMSELAGLLGITKQQLTKLVNDLEEKDLVARRHDTKNRRQVCLTITPQGRAVMAQLRAAMLEDTVSCFSALRQEELEELNDCLIRLSRLLSRCHPAAPKILPGDVLLSAGQKDGVPDKGQAG